jgi:hypothetical protein
MLGQFDLTTGHCVPNPLASARVNLAPLRRFDTRQIAVGSRSLYLRSRQAGKF